MDLIKKSVMPKIKRETLIIIELGDIFIGWKLTRHENDQ